MDRAAFLADTQDNHPSWISSNDAISHVALTTSIAPLCLLLREAVIRILGVQKNGGVKQFMLDFMTISVPILLAFTVASKYEASYHGLILLFTLIIFSVTLTPGNKAHCFILKQHQKYLSIHFRLILVESYPFHDDL